MRRSRRAPAPPCATPDASAVSAGRTVIRYFRNLLTGALPLSRVLWFDTILVGSAVNVATLVATLMLFVAHAPTALAFAVFLAPIPYNLALFVGVWRSASREKDDWAFLARAIASIWLVAAVVLV